MQDLGKMMSYEALNVNSRKQKSRKGLMAQVQDGDFIRGAQELGPSASVKHAKKSTRKNLKNGDSPLFVRQERTGSPGLLETSTYLSEYRALNQKYLALGEESFSLGEEFREVEEDIKNLEEEKLALLDQLVVLEGLVDPPEPPK